MIILTFQWLSYQDLEKIEGVKLWKLDGSEENEEFKKVVNEKELKLTSTVTIDRLSGEDYSG